MTGLELKKCMPYASLLNCNRYAKPLEDAAEEFGIESLMDAAHFLAQIAHESSSLSTVVEYASGRDYEGRIDLGNISSGDGVKYKGHGLIQTTGKTNHFRVADYFGIPREQVVDWLQTPEGAARSAGLFWRDKGISSAANEDNIMLVTRLVNGGYNGLDERKMRLHEAKKGLGIA